MGILDAFKRKKKEDWPEIGTPAEGGYGPGFIGAPVLPGALPSANVSSGSVKTKRLASPLT